MVTDCTKMNSDCYKSRKLCYISTGAQYITNTMYIILKPITGLTVQ